MVLRKLLDRYIFTELLSPFLISLGALCFVMLTRELLRLVELLLSKGSGFRGPQSVANLFRPFGPHLPIAESSPRSPPSAVCRSIKRGRHARAAGLPSPLRSPSSYRAVVFG